MPYLFAFYANMKCSTTPFDWIIYLYCSNTFKGPHSAVD